jgi:hypothetical protein
VGDGGWTFAHDNGRKAVEKEFGDKVVTTFVEKVPESADAERVFRDLAGQGNKLIFGTTFGYMEPMLKVAADTKDVKFEHATGYKQADNLRTYDSRTYEGAYLAGVIAGKMTKSNTLGVVGSIPIPEVIRNINSFTLGAQSSNPKIKTKVVWVNEWFNPPKETEAAQSLINGGADVLFQNTDSSAVLQTAGTAKKYGMVNALMLAGKLLASLPREGLSPETTELREGYLHPVRLAGNTARCEVDFILRDFDNDKLAAIGDRLRGLCQGLAASEPRARIECTITPSYRNMGYWLRDDMRPVEFAREAMSAVGLTPESPAIRGGTDGSRLTERGLPTPNLFTGGHNPHGPLEWASVQAMEKAVEVGVRLAQLWAEQGASYPRRYSR